MVIFVIDLRRIYADKTKRHAPIAADLNGPGASPRTLQFVKVQAGQVHVARIGRGVQPAENQPKPVCVSRLDASLTASGEEVFETLMPKCPDRHSMSVTYMVTDGNLWQFGSGQFRGTAFFEARHR